MFATQVLVDDLTETVVDENDYEEIVGLIEVREKRYEIRKGETKIGRDPTVCSIVIENFAVSKVHAVIESDGIDDTFIYDFNSTNQTKLGKKVLKPHCRYKLEHDSKITIGNIILKFMLPHKMNNGLEEKPTLGSFISSNALEDIFDVPTQACVPHQNPSGDVLKKVPENYQVFKIPESVVPQPTVEDSVKSTRNSTEVTKVQLGSENSVSRTEYCNDSVNASCIFSLNTQCQIIQPADEKQKPDGVCDGGGRRSEEGEKIKSLLNDGQDDVLCSFMSLHSPSGQALKIKTEVTEPDLSQVFDAETQIQAVVQPSGMETEESASHTSEESNSEKSQQPNIASIPNKTGVNNSEMIDNAEEDFIKTQEFNINEEANVVSSDADQESGTACYFEKTIDFTAPMENSPNEDSICTQKFNFPEESSRKATNEASLNQELNESGEDFVATQLFDEQIKGAVETTGKSVSLIVLESQQENDVEESADISERNPDEDLISTQVFAEITSAENANPEGLERDRDDDSDEDLIATQPTDFLVTKNKQGQEPNPKIQSASRESSPNLLDSEFCARIADDFIDTQTFEDPLHSSKAIPSEKDSTSIKKEINEDPDLLPRGLSDSAESSGDETESDLEIIFQKNGSSDKKTAELSNKSFNAETQQPENSANVRTTEELDDDSHSSYVFQLQAEPEETRAHKAGDSDSDVTDCEEVAVVSRKMSIKQEPPEKVVFEDTQVLTLTPPNYEEQAPREDFMTEEKSKFEDENECWSQLSLAMPNTQDMENTINKIIRRERDAAGQGRDRGKDTEYQTPAKIQKTEVGVEFFEGAHSESKRQVDSPLKRPGNTNSEAEAVPPKKSKTDSSDRRLRSSEKQFSRLWQLHDIEQIQPSRTRNSMRNGAEMKSNQTDATLENISNELPNSRRKAGGRKKNNRKLSYDITPYLSKKAEKKRTSLGKSRQETPPKENRVESVDVSERVLRSTRRYNGSTPLGSSRRSSVNSRPRRRSRGKSEDYFGSTCVNVVFTGFDCESLEKIITDLGGKTTSDLSSGDVVVADKVRRTVKFLSAVGLSLPITSPRYLMSSRDEKRFLNPWDFILKDEEAEDKWNFELKTSLQRSATEKLMLGLSVFATKNAKPPVKDLLAIVECCGGVPLFEPPKVWPKNTIIASCLEDESYWPLARLRNIKIVHYEFILSGVLTQRLDFKTYRLR